MTTTSKVNSKKKKTKKTTGISRRLFLSGLAAAASLSAADPYALLAGTVFRENGLAFPGASIQLSPREITKKRKPVKVLSSPRGEFAVRVPPGPAEYLISVEFDGYQRAEKSVKLVGEERIDVSFLMELKKKL
jgi:hypothetical protein